jgi:tetratricopeptide (TPR) repeat protein
MYHLLTNHEPDPIQTPASGSILAKNPRLHTVQIGNRVVCPVEQVIIKAMQQEPTKRFQSAEAMRVALQQCLPNGAAPATVQIQAISPNATIMVPRGELICPKCGYRNRPGAKFCKRDGQPLIQGAIAVPPRVAAQAVSKATLPPRPVQQVVQPSSVAVNVAHPVDSQAAYRLGLQFMNSKNYAEAVNQFKMAQVPGNGSYDVLYNLGRAYRQYGQSVKDKDKHLYTENMKFAAEQFEQAIALKRDAVDAYFQLGMTYHDLGLFASAITAFKNALLYSPKDSAIFYQLGTVAMDQFYDREAEAYFLEGLKITPDHVLILVALGRLYIRMNQAQAAINVLRQATQRDPAMWEGWYELGRAHMKARQWKLALSALEQARQWNFEESEIYSAMASCYLKTNKKAEARQMVRESLQRNPNNTEANRLQKQL